MSIFGDLERLLSEDLYPYRWPLVIGMVVATAAFVAAGWQRGWHRWVWSHRLRAAAIGAPLVAMAAVGSYPLVSPLFERSTVCEASPIAGTGAGSEACMDEPAVATTPAARTPGASTAGAPTPDVTASPGFEARVALEGEFKGADDFHFGRGKALLIETAAGEYTLRFEEFSVRNGPDLFVYLSPDAEGYADGALKLGGLKGTDGAFNYEVPAGTDVSQFKSAVVWCDAFDVLFASASLSEAN